MKVFSNKIADSLSSGTCFFVYAQKYNASVKYLLENKAACVVTSKKDLNETIRNLMTSKELKQHILKMP